MIEFLPIPIFVALLFLYGRLTVRIYTAHDALVRAGRPVPRWLGAAETVRRYLANED